MQVTIVEDRSLVDGSLYFGETTFSFEDFVIWAQPDNQTSTLFALSPKIVFLQMSCKADNTKELPNDENKQFDTGG